MAELRGPQVHKNHLSILGKPRILFHWPEAEMCF
jgi:hypothetical protein